MMQARCEYPLVCGVNLSLYCAPLSLGAGSSTTGNGDEECIGSGREAQNTKRDRKFREEGGRRTTTFEPLRKKRKSWGRGELKSEGGEAYDPLSLG